MRRAGDLGARVVRRPRRRGCSRTHYFGERRGDAALEVAGREATLSLALASSITYVSATEVEEGEPDDRRSVERWAMKARWRGRATATSDGGVRLRVDRSASRCDASRPLWCDDVTRVRAFTCRWATRPVVKGEVTTDEKLLRCVADRSLGIAGHGGERSDELWLSSAGVEVHNDELGLYPMSRPPRFSRLERP